MSLVVAVGEVLRDGLPGLFGGGLVLAVDRASLCVEAMPSEVDAEPRQVDGVAVVRTRLHVAETVHIGLSGVDAAALERAEVLVLAVLALEGRRIAEASRDEYLDGDYGAIVLTEGLDVRGSTAQDGRVIEVRARREITANRVLREGEGQPITRIHGPGVPPRPGHPVDVPIEVDA